MNRNMDDIAKLVLDDIREITDAVADELDELQGKSILFTGGAGFLGYEFIHTLMNIGQGDGRVPVKLTICDNFSRGKKKWIETILKAPNVSLLEHNIANPLPAHVPDFDYIVHAASVASPIFYRIHPIETIDANLNGIRHLLDYALARAKNNKPILGMLFFSTSEIYGDPSPDCIPTDETYRGFVSCTGPRACYDESKRLGETLCVNFANQFQIPVSIARPFNNYGPGLFLDDRRLIPDLMQNILNNEDILLLSDGSATRTFCYISDAVAGYIKVLINGRRGEPYNIGTEKPEISVLNLAKLLTDIGKSICDYRGEVTFGKSVDEAYVIDNPNRRCPNILKARRELGYNPTVSLEEGLKRSLNWYMKEQK